MQRCRRSLDYGEFRLSTSETPEIAMNVFDTFVDDYDSACSRGLQLSGEHRDYFARKRVEYTKQFCAGLVDVRTILDFGCGMGHTTPHFVHAFNRAKVVGIDTARLAIDAARRQYSHLGAEFFLN